MLINSSTADARHMDESEGVEEDDFTLLAKIPHGIQQKRSNRRKSTNSTFHNSNSNNHNNQRSANDSGIISTVPLTAPRQDGRKAISRKSLIKSKANLDAKLRGIDPNVAKKSKKRRQSKYFGSPNASESDLPEVQHNRSSLSGNAEEEEEAEIEIDGDSINNVIGNEVETGRQQEDVEYDDEDVQLVNNNDLNISNRVTWNHNKNSSRNGNGNQSRPNYSDDDADDSYPHTPVENEILTPLVSPGFSFKRRSLVGEVRSHRKIQKRNPKEERNIGDELQKENVSIENGHYSKSNGFVNNEADNSSDNENNKSNDDDDDSVILDNEKLTKIHHSDFESNEKLEKIESSFLQNGNGNGNGGALESSRAGYGNGNDESDHSAYEYERSNNNIKIDDTYNQTEDRDSFYSVASPEINEKARNESGQKDRNKNKRNKNKGPSTPTRMTEAVAVSPRTEQESRIIDEAEISLDTSKPANVEPPESPLESHKKAKSPATTSAHTQESTKKIQNKRHSILEMLDKEGDDLLSELTKLVSETLEETIKRDTSQDPESSFENPSDKPTFTIKQFAKIQNQYDEDLGILKTELNNKNKEILRLSENLSSANLKIQTLQNQVDNSKLIEKQLSEKNKVLSTEFELFEKNLTMLQLDVQSKDEKLSLYIKLSNRFKDLYKEKQLEINNLRNENAKQLSTLEVMQEEKTNLINKNNYLEEKIDKLNDEVNERVGQYRQLNDDLRELKDKHEAMDEENYGLKHQIETINKEKEHLEELLAATRSKSHLEESEKTELKLQIDKLESQLEELQHDIGSLNQELENYKDELQVKRLENEQVQSEVNELNVLLKSKNNKLQEYEAHASSLNDKFVDALNETKLKLSEINEANNKIGALNEKVKDLQEENSDLSAQFNSVLEELVSVKDALKTAEHDYEALQKKYESKYSESTDKDQQLLKYQEKLTKMEENHIEELEKIQHEISSLQHSINSKNTELSHLQDSNDSLVEENHKLNDKVNSSVKELSQAKKQIEQLKALQFESEKKTESRLTKLSEDLYIQYSKKHEQKIAILKKGYETKWQSKLNNATATAESWRREVQGLKDQLANERKEKSELVKLWDKMVKMEEAGNKISKSER